MFAVETKHGQKNSQMKKRENVCTQNFVLREQSGKCHWNLIWVIYLKMFLIFLGFKIMRYKKLIKAKVYMFAGSTC